MVAPDRDIAQAAGFIAPPGYSRHRPETTLLYRLVAEHYPRFSDRRAAEGLALPRYVEDEFEAYLKCGLLEHGFLRVKCESCRAEKLVAFSCKRRGFCPSCGARRMAETAALLVDDVLPRQPVRQWVLSLPFALRYLLATRPEVVTQVLGIVYRAISGRLIRKASLTRASGVTGAVTLIQRFGSALNLDMHT
jgi:ribosomal protein S27E